MKSAYIPEANKTQEEIEAIRVAEDSREQTWSEPSFVADLFMGRLRMGLIDPYPEQPEEDRRIGDQFLARLDRVMRKHDADKTDREGEIPAEILNELAAIGAFGMKIPKEYGGLGLSQVNYCRAIALVASYCGSVVATLSAHQSIGVPQPLRLFGTEEQKRKYLPKLAAGAISAFALTEPGVGSDPAKMSTTAVPSADGSHYVLNGQKLWCTNGANADFLVVMAKTPSIRQDGREKQQITAFIVERAWPGVRVAHRCRLLGLNGIQNALLEFKDVRVPKENILWGTGKGLRLALVTLNAGRLSLPAGCVGGVRNCLQMVREWGGERVQWGQPIGKHEAGAAKVAGVASLLYAMESITWLASIWVDRKSMDIRLEAAMAKVFCSERSHQIMEDCLQLRGGRGYERYSSLVARGEKAWPVERWLRDSRINQIVEGTSEILKLYIARECLDRHLRIASGVLDHRQPIGKRLAAALKAAAFYSVWYPAQWLSPSALAWFPLLWPLHGFGKLASHERFIAWNARRLARAAFHLMLRHGPALERRQLQLMRLVDAATELFAMSAVVARAKLDARRGSAREVELAHAFCEEAKARTRIAFREIRANQDSRLRKVAASVLRGDLKAHERDRGVEGGTGADRSVPSLGAAGDSGAAMRWSAKAADTRA